MINDHIQAALASERVRDPLAEAEASRRARQARSHRQWPGMPAARRRPLRKLAAWLLPGWRSGQHYAARGKPAVLRDGSEVLIRPVGTADAPLLADGFARLSARSRQMRFLVSAGSPHWSRPTMWRWLDWHGPSGRSLSAASPPPWSTRSRWFHGKSPATPRPSR